MQTEELIINKSKLIALSILPSKSPNNNKILANITNKNSNHYYLENNNILSINEYNQRLMYMKEDDFLIKLTNEYIEILFIESDNIIISLKWNYSLNNYSVQYNTTEKETSIEITDSKITFTKGNSNTKYNHTFNKSNHTTKDYTLLANLLLDFLEINEIETEVINYIEEIYPNLSYLIAKDIEELKNNLLNDISKPNNYKHLKHHTK